MALSPQLLQFKSSGRYRLEFDKSQTANINVETLRLIVGHSRKGPYNTPVLIDNVESFRNVFGSIDRNLERKGMFFHRSAIESLSRGPILALNINNFEPTDEGYYVKPITNGSATDLEAKTHPTEYTNFFDMDKFMTPSDKSVLELGSKDENQLINFVNIKQTPITVFIRKAQGVAEFNITAREWYGDGEVPSFINPFDYISDFMVDVFVFKGKFEPSDMNDDPVYGQFFNEDGLEKDLLNRFTNQRQVTLEAQYTGSLIPGFKDLEGRNLYIESTINAEARRTGLFCAVDEDGITDENGTKLDLVGHMYEENKDQELLSYIINDDNPRVIDLEFGEENKYTVSGTSFNIEVETDMEPESLYQKLKSVLKSGDYVSAATSYRLAKINRVQEEESAEEGYKKFTFFCDVKPAETWDDYYIKSFENATSVYKPFVLKGADIKEKEISDYLDVLRGGNGIYDTLIDKDAIDFRYVVDTFASFSNGNILNKKQLSQLAKDRQNASAILNAPTVKDFKASTDPSFKDSFDNTFKTQFIAQGGNQDLNPTRIYTLPSIQDGANYAFYYAPGLVVSDNGKDIIVPPAAYVANNYLDKFTTDLPWSIIAGPRRGVVSGAGVGGVEYSFDKNDRDILEPFGINPIVFQRGVGLTITGNKTAQQSIKSALSSAHVREMLIFIQNGIADILKDYVFEFNTVQTRLEIKTLVDSFMEGVKQDGGVFEYRNIMDQTNNTDDVIDQNFGIIDTYVEPVKGLEIVVHRTTVLNTGQIETGNFL